MRWSDDDYAEKLRIGGGKERMASLLTAEFVRANGLPADADGQRELLADWHRRKTAAYKAIVAEGRLPARPGHRRASSRTAIGGRMDAGGRVDVGARSRCEAVLEHAVGPERAAQFAVLAGDIVPKKKPDPGIYLAALERTGVRPDETIVVEDSRNGLLAAVAAGLRCVVTVSSYTGQEDMHEAALVVSDLGDPGRPMRVLANRSPATPGEMVTLNDLQACLAVPAAQEVR